MFLMNIRRLPVSYTSLPFVSTRFFHHSLIRNQLLYKNKKPNSVKSDKSAITKTETTPKTEQEQEQEQIINKKKLTKLEIKYERLINSKLYKSYIPNFIKPYIKLIYTKTLNFTLAFAILHELTAIVPFLGLWMVFIKYNWIPLEFNLPLDSLEKGFKIISDNIANVDRFTTEEKNNIIVAGANSYAFTKLLLPIRIPLSVLLSPSFDKWIIVPFANAFRFFGRLFGLSRRKAAVSVVNKSQNQLKK